MVLHSPVMVLHSPVMVLHSLVLVFTQSSFNFYTVQFYFFTQSSFIFTQSSFNFYTVQFYFLCGYPTSLALLQRLLPNGSHFVFPCDDGFNHLAGCSRGTELRRSSSSRPETASSTNQDDQGRSENWTV